jgi:hypothetical protein
VRFGSTRDEIPESHQGNAVTSLLKF